MRTDMLVLISDREPMIHESTYGKAYVFENDHLIEGVLTEDGIVADSHHFRGISDTEAENALRLIYDKHMAVQPIG